MIRLNVSGFIPRLTHKALTRGTLWIALALAVMFVGDAAKAGTFTWTKLTGGNASGGWNTQANWSGGTLPTTGGDHANFSALDLTTDAVVTLDGNKTINAITFADLNTATPASWTLDAGTPSSSTLTLDGGSPTVTVNALASGKAALISAEIAGTNGLIKAGAGFFQLAGANTYSGGTILSGPDCRISLGHDRALGTGPVTVGATVGAGQVWFQSAGNRTLTNDFEIRTIRWIIDWNSAGGAAAGDLVLNGNVFLNMGGSNVRDIYCGKKLTFNGNVTVTPAGNPFNKQGGSTLTLNGTNIFTGPTTIYAGTLLVNGRHANTNLVTVNSGATLGGTGVVDGAVSVLDGATLQPGAGQLTLGSLNLSPSALLRLTLDTTNNPANSSLRVNGNLVLDGRVLVTDPGGFQPDGFYAAIHYTGSLINNGLIVDTNSAWNVSVDTSVPNLVRLSASPSLTTPVRVYENPNYTGWSAGLAEGDYTAADLAALGAVNNAASSIQVPAGWAATLYDGDNFTGASVRLTADATNLSAQSFDNLTTSIRVRGPGDREAVASGNWSSPATWGGLVPGVEEDVDIPSGLTVTLDAPAEAGSVTVRGVLTVGRTNCSLIADTVVVTGPTAVFEVGTEASPFLQSFTLTLKGLDTEADSMMGAKVLGSMNGGSIHIHGPARTNWTKLNATAPKNATSITLAVPVDWQPGEEIIIASTDFDAHQAEKRTITTVSSNKLTVTFSPPLQWMHFGVNQIYTNTTRSFTLDERAEVGLLTRNIKIQGDAASDTNGLGGHIMVMLCPCGPTPGKGWIEGAELFRMGQKGILARYPWHWHFAGDVTGQYIRGCSIHKSFNRAVTVHRSNNALVEDNVAYDHIGHGYFLEDGDEIGNTFRRNLGILTRLPLAGEEVRAHDRVFDGEDPTSGGAGGAFTLVKLPATFWITNPSNNFVGNVAAGSEGSGFWMVMLPAPVGSPAVTTMYPGRIPLGLFNDNVSHSCSFSALGIDGGIDPVTHELNGGHYRPRSNQFNVNSPIVIPEITNFTAFKCRDRALWFRADSMNIRNSTLADNSRSTFFAYNQILYDSLIVGQSANTGNPVTATEISAGRSLPNPNSNSGFRGHSIYDGSSGIVRVHFAGFGGNDRALQINGAAQKSPVHFAEGITFAAGMNAANEVDFAPANFRDYGYASGVIDRDGSIGGIAGGRITPNMPASYQGRPMEDFNVTAAALSRPEWTAWITPTNEHYGLLRLDNKWAQYSGTPIYAIAYDTNGSRATWNVQTYEWYSQNPALVNSPRTYGFLYSQIANRIDVQLRFINNDDSLIASFPNLKSATYVYKNNTSTALAQAASYHDLVTGGTERYWFRDNTLHVKLVGAGGGYDPQFGNEFSADSGSIRICQFVNGGNSSGRTDRATLADFEMGNDSRGSFLGTTSVITSAISADSPGVTTGPFDATDNRIFWTLRSNTNGVDESVDYRLTFPRQLWTEFPALRFNYTGPDVELFVADADDGLRPIGVYRASDSQQIRLAAIVPAHFLDNVTGLVARFRESSWATNAVVTTNVNLFGIELLATPTNAYSVSISADRDFDGILDANEPPGDLDQDGLANADDPDSDGDAMEDGAELSSERNPWSAHDFAFHFDTANVFEGWGSFANLTGPTVAYGKFTGTSATGDPYFSRSGFTMPGSQITHVIVKLRAPASGATQFYWGRVGATGFSEARVVQSSYPVANQWQAVRLAVGSHAEWTNQIITSLRVDPINVGGQLFEIDWIRGSAGDLDGDGTPDSVEGSLDTNGDGILDLEDPNAPVITVNSAPSLGGISDRTLIAGQTLLITNIATDAEAPPQTLAFSLLTAPVGVTLNATNGVLAWRPTIAQSPLVAQLKVRVADDGTPSLSATQAFWVTVNTPAQPALSSTGLSNGAFSMSISGDAGPDYTVQAATNLISPVIWNSLATTNPAALPFQFTDPDSSNFNQRYYRILLGP